MASQDPDITKPSSSVADNAKSSKNSSKSQTAAGAKTGKKTDKKSAPNNFKQRLDRLGIRHRPNKKVVTGIIVGIVAVIVIVIAVFGVLIYKYKQTNRAVRVAAAIVPYPVSSVNGSILWNDATYHEYLFELDSVKKFYSSQHQELNGQNGAPKLTDIEKQIVQQLQDRILIAQEARKYKIKLTQKEIDDQFNQLQQNAGGADKVKQTLHDLYGWTVPEFKKQLSYKILEQKLADAVSNDPKLNATAKAQAEDVRKQIENGGDFAELAKKYSQDSSASQGGDLGYFKKGDNVPEFDNAAFALQVGQVSGVVKTQYGYHIIKVTDKKDDGSIRASHILIKTVDLNTWLQQQRDKAKIRVYYNP